MLVGDKPCDRPTMNRMKCVCVCVPASLVGGYTYARVCWVCCQRARLLEGVLLYLPPLLVSGCKYFLFEVYIPVDPGLLLARLTLV